MIIEVFPSNELVDNIIQIKSNSKSFGKLQVDKFKIIDESIILPFNWKYHD